MGVEALNPMQTATLAASESGNQTILISPTGSGKTLAYLLPLLLTLNPDSQKVQAIVVAPSRELVQQIEQVWRSMSTGFKVGTCFGGRPSNAEKKALLVPPSLLVATPGRLQDHIERGNFDLTDIHTIILDEFDKSLEMGFLPQMEAIISRIPSLRTRVLTSATDAVKIPAFVGLDKPVRLDFSEKNNELKGLTIKTVRAADNDKFNLLYNLVCYIGNDPALVFCNQRDQVEKASAYLSSRHVANEFFHGGLEQPDRERALSKFRNGSCTLFVSTDLASRGLDIPEIKHVIHLDPPVRLDEFIHRNGRTARMDASGNAFFLLAASEELPDFVQPTPERLVLPAKPAQPPVPEWTTLYVGKGKKDKISKSDLVGFMFKKGELAQTDLGRVEVKEYYSFVAVRSHCVHALLRKVENQRIKNLKTKIEISD